MDSKQKIWPEQSQASAIRYSYRIADACAANGDKTRRDKAGYAAAYLRTRTLGGTKRNVPRVKFMLQDCISKLRLKYTKKTKKSIR